jgi:hypothetical protein
LESEAPSLCPLHLAAYSEPVTESRKPRKALRSREVSPVIWIRRKPRDYKVDVVMKSSFIAVLLNRARHFIWNSRARLFQGKGSPAELGCGGFRCHSASSTRPWRPVQAPMPVSGGFSGWIRGVGACRCPNLLVRKLGNQRQVRAPSAEKPLDFRPKR